jgi:hypothetical protein
MRLEKQPQKPEGDSLVRILRLHLCPAHSQHVHVGGLLSVPLRITFGIFIPTSSKDPM